MKFDDTSISCVDIIFLLHNYFICCCFFSPLGLMRNNFNICTADQYFIYRMVFIFHFLSLLLLNVFNKVGKVCIRFSFIRQRLSIIYISQLQVFFLNPLYLFCHMFSKINTDKYSTHMFAFIYIRHLHNRLNKCAKKSKSHFIFLSAKHRFSTFLSPDF